MLAFLSRNLVVKYGNVSIFDCRFAAPEISTLRVRSLLVGQEFHHKGHEGLQGHKGKT